MLEVIRCVFCIPEAAEGKLYLLEVLEALEMLVVMRCVLLSMPEAVDGRLCSLWMVGSVRWRRCAVCYSV